MATLIKAVILVLFASVVFARDKFPSTILYWLTYVVMFALVPLWWIAEYWVSEKQAKAISNNDFSSSFFVGMVPTDSMNDLKRGRLCIGQDEIKLVAKTKNGLAVVWSEKIKNIKTIGLGKVAGGKSGFTLFLNKTEVSFTSKKAEEIQRELLK